MSAGNGNGNGVVFKWIAGGLATLLGITLSFFAGRITTLEEKANSISERTARTEVRVDAVKEQLGDMSTTLREIKSEQEATNRYLGLRESAARNPNLRYRMPPLDDSHGGGSP